jgi:hypothetical protein
MDALRLKDESSLILIAESINENNMSDDDVVLPKKISPENEEAHNSPEKEEFPHKSIN